MSNKQVFKLVFTTVSLLIFLAISYVLFIKIYDIVTFDSRIIQSYATDGKYDTNVFFNEEVNNSTKIYDSLIKSDSNPTGFSYGDDGYRLQDLCKYIVDNKVTLTQNMNVNEAYISYLRSKQLTLDDLFNYCTKICNLDSIILSVSFYIVAFFFIIFFAQLFKYRYPIYFITGFLYIVCIFSMLTSSLSDNTIYYIFFRKQESYTDFMTSIPLLLNSIKEAGITFTIFDVIFQSLHTNKIHQLEINLDIFIQSLEEDTNNSLLYNKCNAIIKPLRKFVSKTNKKFKHYDIKNKFGFIDFNDEQLKERSAEIETKINNLDNLQKKYEPENKLRNIKESINELISSQSLDPTSSNDLQTALDYISKVNIDFDYNEFRKELRSLELSVKKLALISK